MGSRVKQLIHFEGKDSKIVLKNVIKSRSTAIFVAAQRIYPKYEGNKCQLDWA